MVDVTNSLLCNKLTNLEKSNFFNSVLDNNLDLFISYLSGNKDRKPYNIFEEVSKPGHKWTVFHYAMHYGKWDIIKYIIEYLSNLNLLDKALQMKTSDNRCPILCLIKSKDLDLKLKKDLYFKIINTFQIPISEEVIDEANNRYFYDDNEDNADLINQKSKVLNSVINGNLEEFKSYINGQFGKPFDIFEEVSKPGFNWTVFHYAMYYGKWNIIQYIIEYLKNSNLLDKALQMKTSDNRCPMLCLVKSNKLTLEQKKEIYFKIVDTFQIPISDEVIEEANKRYFYDGPEDSIYGDLKNELTPDEKSNFYNSAINGSLEEFKSYLNGTATSGKHYNIFEEVSQPGHKWTVFHYAMHYGKWEIIKFIIEYLKLLNLLDKALEMKTNDNRCPLLCLLKSSALKPEEKKIIFTDILNNFDITISNEVKEELYNRNMQDLLK